MNYITHSEKETFELGVEFGKNAKAGEVYALNGSLGSGKSVFARGFARGLGIEAPIPSPTFTVMNMYEEGRLAFYHFDVYRLADQSGDYTLESNGIEREHYGGSDNYALESNGIERGHYGCSDNYALESNGIEERHCGGSGDYTLESKGFEDSYCAGSEIYAFASNGIESGYYGENNNYALESIEAEDQLVDIGFFDYVSAGGVCLIEWALLVEGILPKDTIKINFKKHEGEADVRRIEVMNKGR